MVKMYKVGSHISQEADLIIEEQLLLSPGLWRGVRFTSNEIIKGMERTNWEDPEVSSILSAHPKDKELPSSEDWIGTMRNVRYLTLEDGVDVEGMYGDAYLYDPSSAKKLAYGKAKLAFSIDSPFQHSRFGATNLYFRNTALVYRGGCKDAYIQLSDSEEAPEMRFISQDINIQLEGEVTDDSSKGNDGKGVSNQKTKRIELEDDEKTRLTTIDNDHFHYWSSGEDYTSFEEGHEHKVSLDQMLALESEGHTHGLLKNQQLSYRKDKVKLSDFDKNTKGEIKRVMKTKTSTTSVQLEEGQPIQTPAVAPAPVVTPEVASVPSVAPAPVDTPAPVTTPEPVVAPVTEPVKSEPVKSEPVKSVPEPAKPTVEIVDNSKEIGKLKAQIGGFESKMTELKDLIIKASEPKKEAIVAPATVPKTPVVVKKAAISQTAAQVEGSPNDDSTKTPFEKAHARLNSIQ